jgi:copper chaperone CopZ
MKKLLIIIAAFSFLFACQSNTKSTEANKASAKEKVELVKMEFDVTGMTCTGCEKSVEKGLKKVEGVREVKASHKNNRVTVQVEKDRVDREALAQKIETVGYIVQR